MNQIAPFEKGSFRTLVLSEEANRLVDAINALINMRGENGIKVDVADGNVVITFTGEVAPGSDTGGGGGAAATWTFAGQWVDQVYAKDVVVMRDNNAAIDDGTVAGTYLSLQAVPLHTAAPGTAGAESYWVLIARGWWRKLVFKSATNPGGYVILDCRGDSPGSGGLPMLTMVSTDALGAATGSAIIRMADIVGLNAQFREVNVCDGGVRKRMKVFGTETY